MHENDLPADGGLEDMGNEGTEETEANLGADPNVELVSTDDYDDDEGEEDWIETKIDPETGEEYVIEESENSDGDAEEADEAECETEDADDSGETTLLNAVGDEDGEPYERSDAGLDVIDETMGASFFGNQQNDGDDEESEDNAWLVDADFLGDEGETDHSNRYMAAQRNDHAKKAHRTQHRIDRRVAILGGACAVGALAVALGVILGSGAAQPHSAVSDPAAITQEYNDGSSGDDATAQGGGNLTTSDISTMVESLKLGGREVGIDAASVRIEAMGGYVMVTEAGVSDPVSGITGASMRSAALASAISGSKIAGYDASTVTWVSEDGSGNAKFAVSHDVGGTDYDEDEIPTSTMALDDARGYEVSSDWLESAKPSIPTLLAYKGEALTEPDGTAIEINDARPDVTVADKAEVHNTATVKEIESDTKADDSTDKGTTGSTSKETSNGTSNGSSSSTSGGSASGGESSGGTSSGESTGSSGSTSGGSSSSQKTWVPEKGHYEDVYENVWVDESQQVKETKYVCDRCKREFGTRKEILAHQENAKHGTSFTKKEVIRTIPGGHYERRKVGQYYVVDEVAHWE